MSRKKKTPSDHLTGHVKNEVSKLMQNRHRLLAPFPYDPAAVHAQFFDDYEREAIHRITHRGLINKSDWFYIDGVRVFLQNGTASVKKVTVRCDDLPMPHNPTLSMAELPPVMKEKIAEWGALWYRLGRETAQVLTKLDQLARHCNTFGQAVRVWPELAGFMGDHARYTIDNARVKSRLPEGVCDERWDSNGGVTRTLSELWQPKAFEGLNLLIAEALMLPFSEGQHVATVAD